MPGMAVGTRNTNSVRGRWIPRANWLGQLSLPGEFQASGREKCDGEWGLRNDTQGCPLAYTPSQTTYYTHTTHHTHTQRSTHTHITHTPHTTHIHSTLYTHTYTHITHLTYYTYIPNIVHTYTYYICCIHTSHIKHKHAPKIVYIHIHQILQPPT